MIQTLVFDCPNTGVAVMQRVNLGTLKRRQAAELMCAIQCPCGERHEFPLCTATFF